MYFFILGVYEKFDKVFFLFLFFLGVGGEGGCKLIIYSLMSLLSGKLIISTCLEQVLGFTL